ncbi:MAG TPA: C1 family peptidase [Candidatus Angelobacter sp.]|jgi:cathepsin L|nr:C1 family peptidase [Candidatus Angelobacter sp.]
MKISRKWSTLFSSVLIAALLPGTFLTAQQPPKAEQFSAQSAQVFAEREKTAPPQIKQRLAELRTQIAQKKFTFQVGYTAAADKSLSTLAGSRAPANLPALAEKQNVEAAKFLQVDEEAKQSFLKVHPNGLPEQIIFHQPCAALRAFDWRKQGKVTPVRDQDGCGSCWAFGAMGAYEGNYLIRNSVATDTAEQHALNCSGAGSCGGGWHAGVFDWMISTGNTTETQDPYTANDKPCKGGVTLPYRAAAWGYVASNGGTPSVEQMKAALCQHGPLAVAVLATTLFQHYTGGVFNEMDNTHGINHVVTLIGWDDSKGAWLIKNSWGPYWGETGEYGTERGYMWIAYNSNNIGYGAAWVQAASRFYILPPHFFELKPNIKPFPELNLEREKIPVSPK